MEDVSELSNASRVAVVSRMAGFLACTRCRSLARSAEVSAATADSVRGCKANRDLSMVDVGSEENAPVEYVEYSITLSSSSAVVFQIAKKVNARRREHPGEQLRSPVLSSPPHTTKPETGHTAGAIKAGSALT